MAHQVVWFDLPVTDLDRAIAFYSKVLKTEITKDPEFPVAVLAHSKDEVSGCIHLSHDNKPSVDGALLYFNVQGRLDEAVALAEANGGKLVKAKHQIGPYGYRALVLDTEGNRIALHSM